MTPTPTPPAPKTRPQGVQPSPEADVPDTNGPGLIVISDEQLDIPRWVFSRTMAGHAVVASLCILSLFRDSLSIPALNALNPARMLMVEVTALQFLLLTIAQYLTFTHTSPHEQLLRRIRWLLPSIVLLLAVSSLATDVWLLWSHHPLDPSYFPGLSSAHPFSRSAPVMSLIQLMLAVGLLQYGRPEGRFMAWYRTAHRIAFVVCSSLLIFEVGNIALGILPSAISFVQTSPSACFCAIILILTHWITLPVDRVSLLLRSNSSGAFEFRRLFGLSTVGPYLINALLLTLAEAFPRLKPELMLVNASLVGGLLLYLVGRLGLVMQERDQRILDLQKQERLGAEMELIRHQLELTTTRALIAEGSLRFKTLFESAPVGLVLVNDQGMVLEANRTFGKIFHARPEALVGERLESLLPSLSKGEPVPAGDDVHDQPQLHILASRQTGEPIVLEVVKSLVTLDGKEASLLITVDRTEQRRLEAEAVALALSRRQALEQTVSAQQTALTALQEARVGSARFEASFAGAPVGMLLVDANGQIIMVNEEAARTFEYRAPDLIGKPIEILIEPHSADHHRHLRSKYLDEPMRRFMAVGRQVEGLSASGKKVPVEVALSPIDTGGRLNVLVVVSDISLRVKANEERLLHERKLESINHELENFVYVAAHDLRSPLRAIWNLSGWIQQDVAEQLPPASQEHFRKIRDRAHRMQAMLDSLLSYSRIGREDIPLSAVSLADVLARVLALLNPPAQFQIHAPETFPTLHTHAWPIEQVLRNLLTNAVRHHNREDGQLWIECNELGAFVEISISDDGPGIPADRREQAFRLMSRLNQSSNTYGGMGLPMVKRIVESYGGEVRLEGREGGGTRVRFTWPTGSITG